jgi:hypothetical protein
MLYEYAVEPTAISSDWKTCRYIAELFGFDRGRLLCLFPKAWLRLAIDGTNHLPDVQKKAVIEKLKRLKDQASIRSRRTYDPAVGDWITNAIAQNTADPFRAIIASAKSHSHENVLVVDDVEDTNPLVHVPTDAAIPRDASALAAAMKYLLRSSKTVLFVDPYYDPYDNRYQATLRVCLKDISEHNPGALCEIHHLDGKCPSAEAIERDAKAKFADVIPQGMALSIFRWREWKGGEDFHARYLLTDKGGLGIDAGLSAEGTHQTTIMHLMSPELAGQRVHALAREATVYELIGPVLRIEANGVVSRL